MHNVAQHLFPTLPNLVAQDSYTFMGDKDTVPNTVSHVVIYKSATHIYPGLFAQV